MGYGEIKEIEDAFSPVVARVLMQICNKTLMLDKKIGRKMFQIIKYNSS